MMCSQGIIEIYSKNYPLEKQELTRPLQIYQEFLNMVLKGTNREIKNIAMDLGFNNLSFFNKFFRRNVGMTPQEYRGKSYTYSCYQRTPD